MKINNKNIAEYQASIVSFDVSTLGIDNNIMLLESGYYPVLREQKLTAQERELVMDFTREEDISNFTVECMKKCLLDLDDGYEYVCYLKAAPGITTEGIQAFTVSYPMYVIKRKPMVSIAAQGEVTILGNVWTPCVFEITATQDVAVFTLNELTIKKLKANETFVIDGIQKLIYRAVTPDVSAFDDTDLTMFPKVIPGNMIFHGSNQLVSVVCKYYPTYL